MKHNQDGDKYKEPVRGVHLETRTTTPYCMYCGNKGGQHTPKCELWESMGPNEEPLCTFCGIVGHWADNCAEQQRAFQKQQQVGHLCTFCGSQEHVYFNCVLYRENLKSQKQSISNQNEEKYKMAAASQGGATQTQQGKVHTSKKEGSKTGTQEHTTKSGSPQGMWVEEEISLQENLIILRT